MDAAKQRIAIAEACGWTREYADVQTWNAGLNSYKGGYEPIRTMLFRRREKCVLAENLPDYLADLNAMHEAEQKLFRGLGSMQEYVNRLRLVLGQFPEHATAAQRAEAFLRAINKWEDN